MTYCYVCDDAGEIECPSCRGKGRRGGVLGFGAQSCPTCSGAGRVPCNECDETRDYLLRPEQEPPLIQLALGTDFPHRPAIAPVAPTFAIDHVDWETVEEAMETPSPRDRRRAGPRGGRGSR